MDSPPMPSRCLAAVCLRTNSIRPKIIRHAGGGVYLWDLDPAGTGVHWGSHSRSWGSTAAEIARPCPRRPCRVPWTARNGGRRRWRGCWRHRVFPQHGGAASVGAESGPAAPVTAAWRRERAREGGRGSLLQPAPLWHASGLGSAPAPLHTEDTVHTLNYYKALLNYGPH